MFGMSSHTIHGTSVAEAIEVIKTFDQGWTLHAQASALLDADRTLAEEHFRAANEVLETLPEVLSAPDDHVWTAQATIGHVQDLRDPLFPYPGTDIYPAPSWEYIDRLSWKAIDPEEAAKTFPNALTPREEDEPGHGLFIGQLLTREQGLAYPVERSFPRVRIERSRERIAWRRTRSEHRFEVMGAGALTLSSVDEIRQLQ